MVKIGFVAERKKVLFDERIILNERLQFRKKQDTNETELVLSKHKTENKTQFIDTRVETFFVRV